MTSVGAGSFALRFRRSLSPPEGLNTNSAIFSGQRDGSKSQDNEVCVQRQPSRSGVKRQLRHGGKGEDGPGHQGLHPPQAAQLVGCSLTSPMGTVLSPVRAE